MSNTLTPLEQELVNVGSILLNTLGTAAAAKNPAYAQLIQLGQATVNSINASVNPTQAAAAATLSGDVAAAIQPATSAVSAVVSKTATATQKASAIAVLVGDVENIGAEIISIFKPKTS